VGRVRLDIVHNVFLCLLRMECMKVMEEAVPTLLAYVRMCRDLGAVRTYALAILCRCGAKSPQSFAPFTDELVDILLAGNTELSLVLQDLQIFDRNPGAFSSHASALLETLPLDCLLPHLARLLAADPDAFLPCLPRLTDDIQDGACTKKTECVELLMRLALVRPAPILTALPAISAGCMSAGLYTPYMRLLAALAAHSKPAVFTVLRELTGLLRSTENLDASDLYALLGALDVAKDHCPYSSIFSADTLMMLELAAQHNRTAYLNLIKWNSGEWAYEGDVHRFLDKAGRAERRLWSRVSRYISFAATSCSSRGKLAVQPIVERSPFTACAGLLRLPPRSPLRIPPSDEVIHRVEEGGSSDPCPSPQENPSNAAVVCSFDSDPQTYPQQHPLAPLAQASALTPIEFQAGTRGSFLVPLEHMRKGSFLDPLDYTAMPVPTTTA
jgi:hypothetical protein